MFRGLWSRLYGRSPACWSLEEPHLAMAWEATAGDITRLPEDCVAHILSLTTPRDACRSATVATLFRSAAETDAVWERFLPADYSKVLARATEPVEFRSKKELYFRLCQPLLIDGGRKSFSLDRSTGRKICMLSARDLSIVWGENPHHWSWSSLHGSRFAEVAELLDVWWFHISAKLSTSVLTPEATYVANLVYRLFPDAQGLKSPPQKVSITVGPHTSDLSISLQSEQQHALNQRRNMRRRYFRESGIVGNHAVDAEEAEIVLGEFVVEEGCDEEVEIVLSETSGVWKTGLIVEGIEFRPKN